MVRATTRSKSKETEAMDDKPPASKDTEAMDEKPPTAAAEATTETISLKLMIDWRTNKVVFAEAGKGMVDFLFGLLTLPISSAVRLLNSTNGGGMPGCISQIYSTAASFGTPYMENPSTFKPAVLFPPAPTGAIAWSCPRLLRELESQEAAKEKATSTYWRCKAYSCSKSYCSYVSLYRGDQCPICQREMEYSLTLEGEGKSKGGFRGFVRDLEYMITDDLRVLPSSAFSCMELLQGSGVKTVWDLEERVVTVSVEHGLALLKASLESDSALTDVFLGKTAKTTQAEKDVDEDAMCLSSKGKAAKMAKT